MCQLLCSVVIGTVFVVYANNVETHITCWSDGNIALPIPFSEDFADVAKSFQVTLQGCGIAPFASVLLLLLALFHLKRGKIGMAGLFSVCNLCVSLVSLGFMIALFVYRLRPSGVLCSEPPFLVERGKFIYIFFWVIVGCFGCTCVIGSIAAYMLYTSW